MAQSGLIWKLKNSFNFFYNGGNSTGTMMDEMMVSRSKKNS
jgi:hypothetical protein